MADARAREGLPGDLVSISYGADLVRIRKRGHDWTFDTWHELTKVLRPAHYLVVSVCGERLGLLGNDNAFLPNARSDSMFFRRWPGDPLVRARAADVRVVLVSRTQEVTTHGPG